MRRLVIFLATLILLALAGWLSLWWTAQNRLAAGLTGWAAQASAQGNVKVSYASVSTGASPLAASATLNNVQIIIQIDPAQAPASISLPSLGLRIEAASPLLMHIDLPAQIGVTTARGDLVVTFGSVELSEELDLQALQAHQPYPFKTADWQASDINLLASSGSLQVLHLDSFSLHSLTGRDAAENIDTVSCTGSFSNIALSPILTRLANIPFNGQISALAFNFDITGAELAKWQSLDQQLAAFPALDIADRNKISLQTIHDWAAEGGTATGSLSLVLGPTTLDASSTVKFDANAQAAGAASLTANHLDALSAAITAAYPFTQNAINNIEAKLSPDLSSTDAGGQTLAINLTYGNGAVIVNGQSRPLPPINWNLLENPPPQAPGDGSGAATQ